MTERQAAAIRASEAYQIGTHNRLLMILQVAIHFQREIQEAGK